MGLLLAQIFADNWESIKAGGDLLGHLWPYFLLIGAGFAIARRWFKKVLHDSFTEWVEPLQKEFKNNGGSSMKDAVDRIDRKLDDTNATLAEHTNSDSANFEAITSTLSELIDGQDALRKHIDGGNSGEAR